MWTNKQIWGFEQINEITFDMTYAQPKEFEPQKTKLSHADSDIRDVVARTYEELEDNELHIASKGADKIEGKHMAYVMSVIVDVMVDEEICLNFRMEDGYLVVALDPKADVIDCKEFFEAFYHLTTGFNFDDDTGIPDDETEAEQYLIRLQEEFDEKMIQRLEDLYLTGNNDPDTLDSK